MATKHWGNHREVEILKFLFPVAATFSFLDQTKNVTDIPRPQRPQSRLPGFQTWEAHPNKCYIAPNARKDNLGAAAFPSLSRLIFSLARTHTSVLVPVIHVLGLPISTSQGIEIRSGVGGTDVYHR